MIIVKATKQIKRFGTSGSYQGTNGALLFLKRAVHTEYPTACSRFIENTFRLSYNDGVKTQRKESYYESENYHQHFTLCRAFGHGAVGLPRKRVEHQLDRGMRRRYPDGDPVHYQQGYGERQER